MTAGGWITAFVSVTVSDTTLRYGAHEWSILIVSSLHPHYKSVL